MISGPLCLRAIKKDRNCDPFLLLTYTELFNNRPVTADINLNKIIEQPPPFSDKHFKRPFGSIILMIHL